VLAWNLSASAAQSPLATCLNKPNIKIWHSSEGTGRHYLASEFEYRLPAALFALLPLIWIARLFWIRIRTARRMTTDACAECGYDLRATPERCPECGAVPTKK